MAQHVLTILPKPEAICGVTFVALARSSEADRRFARHLFGFSILYLFVLFAALLGGKAP